MPVNASAFWDIRSAESALRWKAVSAPQLMPTTKVSAWVAIPWNSRLTLLMECVSVSAERLWWTEYAWVSKGVWLLWLAQTVNKFACFATFPWSINFHQSTDNASASTTIHLSMVYALKYAGMAWNLTLHLSPVTTVILSTSMAVPQLVRSKTTIAAKMVAQHLLLNVYTPGFLLKSPWITFSEEMGSTKEYFSLPYIRLC